MGEQHPPPFLSSDGNSVSIDSLVQGVKTSHFTCITGTQMEALYCHSILWFLQPLLDTVMWLSAVIVCSNGNNIIVFPLYHQDFVCCLKTKTHENLDCSSVFVLQMAEDTAACDFLARFL